MPLSSTDLVWYYTNTAEGPADADESIGGTINADNSITSGQDENVFDDVTGAESESGESHYRAIALLNNAAAHDYLNYEAWIEGFTRSGTTADTILFSLATIDVGSSIELIADEFTAPDTTNFIGTHTWVVEGSPSDTIPSDNTYDLAHGDWLGIWFWRTIPAGASAYTNRNCTLKFRGETTGSPMMIIEKTWRVNFQTDGQISVQEL